MASSENNQKAKQSGAISAHELCPGGIESEPWRLGRRLILKFIGGNHPELDRIQCRWSQASQVTYWQQGDPPKKNPMSWTGIPQALSLMFLDYLAAAGKETVGPTLFHEANSGGLTTTLGNAITDKGSKLHDLLTEWLPPDVPRSQVSHVFAGKNVHGKEEGDRRIFVRDDFLPPDCIEVYWVAHGPGRITDPEILRELARRIRVSLGIPVEPVPQVGEGGIENKAPTAPPEPAPPKQLELPKEEPKPPAEPVQSPLAEPFKLGKWLADEIGQAMKSLREQAKERTAIEDQAEAKRETAEGTSQKIDVAGDNFAVEAKGQREAEEDSISEPSLPPIDPSLFEIRNPDRLEWLDSDGLLNFSGDDSEADLWRIRDASEGLLIFGAVGSGKTSGSGSAFARAFLQAGFGGLVMTAKPDEARRWLRMCEETGRAADCVHVTPGSGHKLSFLQYESQRPGDRLAVTDDLITLFRCLIGVMSRSKRIEIGDDFWINTTNQLMRKLMDIMLLAGEPLTLNGMVRFINLAPKDPGTDWRAIKLFASVITRAEKTALEETDEDKRIYREAFEYWTQAYPKIADITRSGFITAFSAMADTLSGRGIYEMICTETNLTPEMILSGKIVILDIPLKGNIQGGLMVQSLWKLLFQQAIERRADKGLKTARPAFLWEDEGHEFFSQNDVRFQPYARDCRAPHVIISQNIHNFLHLGHDQHAVQAVFAAMNTYIFHTNGDLDTNRWASERIGGVKKLKLTTDGLLKPLRDKDISFFDRQPEEVESVGKMKISEETKQAMLPEDFAKLQRGGEGTCEAVILWLAHRFAANQNRNFCVLTFEQEKQTT
jgi:hypothetical protein